VIAEENIDCLTVGAMTSVAMSGLANKRRELYDEMTRLKIAHKPIWIGMYMFILIYFVLQYL